LFKVFDDETFDRTEVHAPSSANWMSSQLCISFSISVNRLHSVHRYT